MIKFLSPWQESSWILESFPMSLNSLGLDNGRPWGFVYGGEEWLSGICHLPSVLPHWIVLDTWLAEEWQYPRESALLTQILPPPFPSSSDCCWLIAVGWNWIHRKSRTFPWWLAVQFSADPLFSPFSTWTMASAGQEHLEEYEAYLSMGGYTYVDLTLFTVLACSWEVDSPWGHISFSLFWKGFVMTLFNRFFIFTRTTLSWIQASDPHNPIWPFKNPTWTLLLPRVPWQTLR